MNLFTKTFGYLTGIGALTYAIMLMLHAAKIFHMLLRYYSVAPDLLVSFPVVDGRVNYLRGVPTMILVFAFLVALATSLVGWVFGEFRNRYRKTAIAICILTVFSDPLGAFLGVFMGILLFIEVKSVAKR